MSADAIRPAYYRRGQIEVWDFILDQQLDFVLGTALKYICRAGHKSAATEVEDLEKARAYIDKAIQVRKQRQGGGA